MKHYYFGIQSLGGVFNRVTGTVIFDKEAARQKQQEIEETLSPPKMVATPTQVFVAGKEASTTIKKADDSDSGEEEGSTKKRWGFRIMS